MIEIGENRTFHLITKNTSYIFSINDGGLGEHIYYGKRLRDIDISLFAIREKHLIDPPMLPGYDKALSVSLNDMPLEFSCPTTGDYKKPFLDISSLSSPDMPLDFKFVGYDIYDGAKRMASFLPDTDEDSNEATTLEVAFENRNTEILLINYYTVFEESDAILRRSVIKNSTGVTLRLKSLFSSQLDLRERDAELIYLSGDYLRENNLKRMKLSEGTFELSSNTMGSSLSSNPAFGINTPHGSYFMNLLYSSNHKTSITKTDKDLIHILWGINDESFSWTLKNGEFFESPEAVMVWGENEEKASRLTKSFIDRHVRRGKWKERLRPIMYSTGLLNDDNVNEKSIKESLKTIKRLGFEGILIDDGWFGSRGKERNTSLGDWYVNTIKFPSGLKEIGDEIHKEGLLFGLFASFENISEKSELYSKHPEWALSRGLRDAKSADGTLILDITKPKVKEWIITTLSDMISLLSIDYIKWDSLSYPSEIYEKGGSEGEGSYFHRYILSLYEILKTIGRRFPNLFIESSSLGGGRLDPGFISLSSSILITESTDITEAAKTKEGCSMFYPLSVMSTLIGPSPSYRREERDLYTSFSLSLFGSVMYSIDLKELSDEEKAEITEDIAFYKENRILFQYGTFRVEDSSPYRSIWTVSDYDGSKIILLYLLKSPSPNSIRERIYSHDANTLYNYRIYRKDPISQINSNELSEGYKISGDALRYAGFSIPENESGLGFKEGMRRLREREGRIYIIKKDEKLK